MNETSWSVTEKNWFKENFSATDKEVSAWQKYGFSMGEAIEWSHWDVTAMQAAQAIKAGVNQVPDYFLNHNGMSLDSALEWDSHGFGMEEAQMWSDSGVDCEDAVILRNQGLTADSVSDFTFWGLSISQAVKWLAAGFDGSTANDWIDWKVSCEKAKKYSDEGMFEPPADEFREAGLTLSEAMKWAKADIDFDTASGWIDWKVPASVAIEYVLKDIYPPEDEFKEAGMSFDAAMGWICSGLDSEPFEEYDNNGIPFWKNWSNAGFSSESAKVFQSQLVEHVNKVVDEDVLARGRPPRLFTIDAENREKQIQLLLNECVSSLTEIHKSGMKVSLQTVIEWRGLASEQILACIDQGFDAETGYNLGDSLLSAEELEMHSLLKETDFYSYPSRFSQCGLNSADLKKLIKLDVNLDLFVSLCISFRLEGKELCKWAKEFKNLVTEIEIDEFGERKSLVADWMKREFSPKEAWGWYSENFTATTAKAWLDSGVADPTIAKRRQDAGLEPK